MKKRVFALILALMMCVGMLPDSMIPEFVKQTGIVSSAQAYTATSWCAPFPNLAHFHIGRIGIPRNIGWPVQANHEGVFDNSFYLDTGNGENSVVARITNMTKFAHTSGITEIVAPILGMYRAGDIGDGRSLTTAYLNSTDCWRWYNERQYKGMAYQGAHALEPTTISSIRADIGATTRNGVQVQNGDTVKFYVHGTDTLIGEAVAGSNGAELEFSSPRYYFDLYAANAFASANYDGLEMVTDNNCASFCSFIATQGGLAMYAAWAATEGDGYSDKGFCDYLESVLGSNIDTTFYSSGIPMDLGSGTLSNNCTVTVDPSSGITSGDFIQVDGHHMMYVADSYESEGRTHLRLYAHSTSAKGHLNAQITAVSKASKLAIDIEVENEEEKGSLTVTKVSSTNSDIKLDGVVFRLDGTGALSSYSVEKTTGSNGIAEWTDLSYGTYTLTEVSGKTGYAITYTPENIVVDGDETKTVTNKPYAYIEVYKVNSNGTSALSGAQFTVTNSGGTTVATLTTGSDGKAKTGALDYGTYTVT